MRIESVAEAVTATVIVIIVVIIIIIPLCGSLLFHLLTFAGF